MEQRICPGCGATSDQEVCPACGLRTVRNSQMAPTNEPEVGAVIDGRYRLDALIRKGGMGSIFKATQLATGRVVALKAIRSEYAGDAEAVKRFLREAKAASLLSHPHTIRMFDFGQTESGYLYMVLEYLPGRTLAEVLTEVKALPERRVIKIASEVAAALAEAHEAGLVHRDLKPENIMLLDVFGDSDFVKVFDFGIAKFLHEGPHQPAVGVVQNQGTTVVDPSATQVGAVVGTPHYMAPERAAGEPATPAVDVYALGVIMFEALSGTKPYDADDPTEVMMAHATAPIPDLPGVCVVSAGTRALLRRLLAKSPEERPTAAQLVAELESLRPEGNHKAAAAPVEARPPSPPPRVVPEARGLEGGPAGQRPAHVIKVPGPHFEAPAQRPPVFARIRKRGAKWAAAGIVALVAMAAFALLAWLGGHVSTDEPPAAAASVPPAVDVVSPTAPQPSPPPLPSVEPVTRPDVAVQAPSQKKQQARPAQKATKLAPGPTRPPKSKYRRLD